MKTDVHINLYRETGYSQQRYNAAEIHLPGPLSPLKKPSSFALLPYVQTTYIRISRMLDDLQVQTPGRVQPRLSAFAKFVSDRLIAPPRLV